MTYKGKCFGGPLNGRVVEHSGTYLVAAVKTEISWGPNSVKVDPEMPTVGYKYEQIAIPENPGGDWVRIGVWILCDRNTNEGWKAFRRAIS